MEKVSVYMTYNNAGGWFSALLVLSIGYGICLALYRVSLDPMARFPGPKIAAMTGYYEFYHDYFRNGMYVYEIEKMHKKYGKWTIKPSSYKKR